MPLTARRGDRIKRARRREVKWKGNLKALGIRNQNGM